jgi:hypothetical protein
MKNVSDNRIKFLSTKKHYYNSIIIYCTIIYNNKNQINFKTGETRTINKCNYKLTFSNTLFEKGQQWYLFSTRNSFPGWWVVQAFQCKKLCSTAFILLFVPLHCYLKTAEGFTMRGGRFIICGDSVDWRFGQSAFYYIVLPSISTSLRRAPFFRFPG